MALQDSIEKVKQALNRVGVYGNLIAQNNFLPGTIDDMKNNAKDLCGEAKAEIDEIKKEIDKWGNNTEVEPE